jgi:WD40 repeat protein
MTPEPKLSDRASPAGPAGLETVVRGFEVAWLRAEHPDIDAALAALAGAERGAALVELVHAELELRLKAGEPARVEDYLCRYPELSGQTHVVVDLIATEHRQRGWAETGLAREDYRARFPHLEAELEALFGHLASPPTGNAGIAPGAGAAGPARGNLLELSQMQAPAESPGEPGRLGPYRILNVLGRGGMGVVYQARHLRLGRVVALKMILAGSHAGEQDLLRFLAEAEAVAALQHPHVVQLFEFGQHNGLPYFTLEFVPGGSLADKLQGTPLAPPEAARLVEQLAHGMAYAHERGIIHRDLKPHNVLLASDGTPKITDFGLAKRIEVGSGLTTSGAVMGTPSYMAPEQAAGKSSEVGPLADVYALGAILYECLTGRPPFKGATLLETLEQVCHRDPVPPLQLQPKVPRDLETICLKCLHKEPGKRYGSAADLADDLRRFLDGESIHARPAGRTERAVKWARRHPGLSVSLAAVVVVVLGLFGYLIQRQRDYDEIKSERDRARKAEGQALEREADARLARYTARMRLASQLLNGGDVFQLPDLLDPYQQPEGQASAGGADPRGFEWWYLRQYSQPARPALVTDDSPLDLLGYSADGKALITTGWPHGLTVWDPVGGQPRWRHKLRAFSLAAFAPGGELLAGLNPDGRTISLWDAATGSERGHLPASNANQVGLSPDGRRLITRQVGLPSLDGRTLVTAASGPLKVWDTATREQRLELSAAAGPVAVTPDGWKLILGGRTDAFRGLEGWDLETGRKPLWQVPLSTGVNQLSCSAGGAYFLVITGDQQGLLWDAKERELVSWQPFGVVESLAISADERTVAAGYGDGSVRIWDVATRRLRAHYRWHTIPIDRLAFSPNGRSLAAAASRAMVVYQLDATACTAPEALRPDLAPAPQVPVWSPDGKTLAVALWNDTVGLLDVPTQKVRAVVPVSRNFAVQAMAFSSDGRTLATGAARERVVRLWDAVDGRPKGVTAAQPLPAESLAFSPDGRRLAAALGTVRLWDVASLTDCGVLQSEFHLSQVAFTPDGRFLIAAGDRELQVWDLDTGQFPQQPQSTAHLEQSASRLAVAPDGRRIAVGEWDELVEFWRLSPEGELTRDLPPLRSWDLSPGRHRVLGLQFGPGGATLLTTLGSGNADLWDLPSGRRRANVTGGLEYGALSPDGNVLAAIDRVWTLQFRDLRTWRVSRPPGQPLGVVTSLAFTAGDTLVTGSSLPARRIRLQGSVASYDVTPLGDTAESVRFWNAATGREVIPSGLQPQETMARPTRVACSPDGRTVAAGCEDGGVWVWDRSEGQLLDRLFVSDATRAYATFVEWLRTMRPVVDPEYGGKTEAVQALAFSPDGNWLAAAGNHGSVRVWRTNAWKEPRTLPCGGDAVAWVGFAPDSGSLATAQGGQVRLWDPRTGELAGTLGLAEESVILAGAFVSGGRRLATGSRDHIIRLWDLSTGKVTGRLVGHQDQVTALALTPDGKTLASSGNWDRTVRLWSMADGSAVATLEGHAGGVQALAFSADGRVLASGSDAGDTGEVLLWRAKRP